MAEQVSISGPKLVTIKDVKSNPKVKKLIDGANEVMKAMGYTEHGHRHVGVVSSITRYILENLGTSPRDIELGQIAGYLHDIGNVINRVGHPLHGASMAFVLLNEMGMDATEIAPILGAIGNHEESAGMPISTMNPIVETYDIHDRVNAAVQKSRVEMDNTARTVQLSLEIDSSIATVMEYFEIFLSRMVMCRRSAELFGYDFKLNVNGTVLE